MANLLSKLIIRQVNFSRCPLKINSSIAFSRSQSLTVLSTLPDTNFLSFEVIQRHVTVSSWPFKLLRAFSVDKSQIIIF